MASTNSTATAKTHVSLRLPTYLLESIDAHAERESISRTEAFVFYLQTGLDIADVKADEPSKDESMLMSIQEDLAEIKALLQQGAGQAVPAQAIAEAVVPAVEATSAFTPEEAAESETYAEDAFTGSDAVSEETAVNEPEEEPEADSVETSSEEPSESAYSAEERAEAETEAEEDYTTSDAVSEEMFSAPETASEEAFVLHETDDEPESDDEDEDREDDTDELAEEEGMFSTSDAVEEEPSSSVFSLYASGDSEGYTEIKPVESIDDFTTSDAVNAEEIESDDEDEDGLIEEASMFSTSDAEKEEPQEMNSFYPFATSDDDESDFDTEDTGEDETFGEDIDEGEDDEASDEKDAVEESYDFDTSDAVDYEEIEDEVDPCDEALSYKKLEKAVAKASKQIDFIEKVWLFGPAADEEEITAPVLDLCVKTEDDKKLKSKHLDPYIAAIEEKTGKIVNVVLRHEIEDKSELQNRVELYKN